MRCSKILGLSGFLTLVLAIAFGQDAALYTGPQLQAALPDGRAINLDCLGQGTPTVILTSGLENWSISWNKVQGPVAAKTRICTWDRAGFGFSDPSPQPQDAEHTLADLEQALAAAKIAGPYILVSQSAGSYESLLFADRHPREVAGMVLADPSIPDQPARFGAISPALLAFSTGGVAQASAALKKCAAELQEDKLVVGGPDPDKCLAYPASYPDALKAALARLDSNPKRQLTKASRQDTFAISARQVVNPKRNYGALPLIVLTAESQGLGPGTPAEVLAVEPAFNAAWIRAHDALAALSTRGSNTVVAGSSHAIPLEKPEAMIAAIDSVIDQARAAPGAH